MFTCPINIHHVYHFLGCQSHSMAKILGEIGVFTKKVLFEIYYVPNGSFTLTETDSGTDSDSNSKPDGYITLCRTCSHCRKSESDPYSLFLCGTGIRARV